MKNETKIMVIDVSENVSNLVSQLEHLGRLPDDFDISGLMALAKHSNENVRYLAIKNLAKLSRLDLLDIFVEIVDNDGSSIVRKEAVSAIGRLRDRKTKAILINYLYDKNPEIVLQAMRGLLVFKKDKDIESELSRFKNHQNEIIREIVTKEFSKESKSNGDHTASPEFMKNVVVAGDVEEIMKSVPNESIHLTFTSPPYYNARDYSIYSSYQEYLDFLERVFKEVHRVTKEGRFFVLNTSPIIIPRVGRQYSSKRYPIPYDIHPLLIRMGWEFIDDIVWVKPEASAKNRNAGFLQHRKPLAYKPNACTECVMVYRKKTSKLIDWNIRQYPEKVIEDSKINGDYESSNIWKIDPTFDKTHSAVFPLDLCNKVIKFYSFKGDLVFDPFAGSGTVGVSAMKSKRLFFLTEKEPKYILRIKENLSKAMEMGYKLPKVIDIDQFVCDSNAQNSNERSNKEHNKESNEWAGL